MERKKPLRRNKPLSQRTRLSRGKGGLGRTPTPSARSGAKGGRRPSADPARAAWKTPRYGRCACCHRYGRLVLHHVLLEQMVRLVDGANPWDLRNAMRLGRYCDCHADHHRMFDARGRDLRIPYDLVPTEAVEYARETIGEGPAANYFFRRYRGAPDPLTARREQNVSRTR